MLEPLKTNAMLMECVKALTNVQVLHAEPGMFVNLLVLATRTLESVFEVLRAKESSVTTEKLSLSMMFVMVKVHAKEPSIHRRPCGPKFEENATQKENALAVIMATMRIVS